MIIDAKVHNVLATSNFQRQTFFTGTAKRVPGAIGEHRVSPTSTCWSRVIFRWTASGKRLCGKLDWHAPLGWHDCFFTFVLILWFDIQDKPVYFKLFFSLCVRVKLIIIHFIRYPSHIKYFKNTNNQVYWFKKKIKGFGGWGWGGVLN